MSPSGKAKQQAQPLTPPLSDRLEQQYLVPSNSASPYQPGPYEFENVPRVPSHSQTTFSSPDSRHVQIDSYGHGPYQKVIHGPNPYQNTPPGHADAQYVSILQTNGPKLLFSNGRGRISITSQRRTTRRRMVRIIIPFGNSLFVTASTSLCRRETNCCFSSIPILRILSALHPHRQLLIRAMAARDEE